MLSKSSHLSAVAPTLTRKLAHSVYLSATTAALLMLNSCAGHLPDRQVQMVESRVTHPPPIGIVERAHSAFERAKALVEQDTGSQLDEITLRLVTNADIQQEVTRETRRLVNNEFTNPTFAERFLTKIVADQTGSYAALYVDTKKQVLVSHRLLETYLTSVQHDDLLSEQALLALLVHELVHAADDQKYGIHKNRILTFKASFTQSAAFEGHAQMVTRRICREFDCLPGMAALDAFMFETEQLTDPVAQSVQAISRNVLEYSYVEGERFLTELSARRNGEELINDVLGSPPDDPVQILVARTYPDTSRERRNQKLMNAIKTSEHQWTQSPWVTVETSPIKGINVRKDPARRKAAIEGFTRLIVSMAGAQLFNQQSNAIEPIDVMLIETDTAETARLFAGSFTQRALSKIRLSGALAK